jgi:hypothetical protein
LSHFKDANIPNEPTPKRRPSEGAALRNFPPKLERGKSDFEVTQPRQPPPKQWVSSCGCVHNILREKADARLKVSGDVCGGCGCICGEGHRHYNQKCGTECQVRPFKSWGWKLLFLEWGVGWRWDWLWGSATPSVFPLPQPPFSYDSFLVHHLTNRGDRHLLARGNGL